MTWFFWNFDWLDFSFFWIESTIFIKQSQYDQIFYLLLRLFDSKYFKTVKIVKFQIWIEFIVERPDPNRQKSRELAFSEWQFRFMIEIDWESLGKIVLLREISSQNVTTKLCVCIECRVEYPDTTCHYWREIEMITCKTCIWLTWLPLSFPDVELFMRRFLFWTIAEEWMSNDGNRNGASGLTSIYLIWSDFRW